jgi:hypothetical protein
MDEIFELLNLTPFYSINDKLTKKIGNWKGLEENFNPIKFSKADRFELSKNISVKCAISSSSLAYALLAIY